MLVASLSLQSNAMVNAGALKLNGIDGIPQAYQRLVEQPGVNCYSGPSLLNSNQLLLNSCLDCKILSAETMIYPSVYLQGET